MSHQLNNPVTGFLKKLNKAQIVPHAERTTGFPSDAKLKEAVQAYCEKAKQPNKKAPKTTHYIFILDGSGSMGFGKSITVDGYNKQKISILENKAETGLTTVTLIDFNSQVSIRAKAVSPEAAPVLTVENYETQGSTALHDAIGVAIETALSLENILGDDTGVLISILTDGEENASKYVSGSALGECVKMLEASDNFTFALMGPNTHLESMAQVLNVKKGNISGFDASSLESKAFGMDKLGGSTVAYASARGMSLKSVANLYIDPNDLINKK